MVAFVLAVTLVALTGCDWTMYRYDAAGTGYNPTETTIGVGNVGQLVQRWTYPTDRDVLAGPVVTGGRVFFVTTDLRDPTAGSLVALDVANGTLLWTAPLGAAGWSAPAVFEGLVYVSDLAGRLQVFDAAGVDGCTGVPAVCSHLWQATLGTGVPYSWLLTPVIEGGVVYVGLGSSVGPNVFAIDAHGSQGCGGEPKVCAPLWSARAGTTGNESPVEVSVAGGRVYARRSDWLSVFEPSAESCGGSPLECAPVWGAVAGPNNPTPVLVADGWVYAAGRDGVDVFDGVTGCRPVAGDPVPVTCPPVWTSRTGSASSGGSAPAVAGGVVVTGSQTGRLIATSTGTGSGCTGSPPLCPPLWQSLASTVSSQAVSIANGVVYAVFQGAPATTGIQAYDLAGSVGCSGAPRQCDALWSARVPGAEYTAAPVIANGSLFVAGRRAVTAWGLAGA